MIRVYKISTKFLKAKQKKKEFGNNPNFFEKHTGTWAGTGLVGVDCDGDDVTDDDKDGDSGSGESICSCKSKTCCISLRYSA